MIFFFISCTDNYNRRFRLGVKYHVVKYQRYITSVINLLTCLFAYFLMLRVGLPFKPFWSILTGITSGMKSACLSACLPCMPLSESLSLSTRLSVCLKVYFPLLYSISEQRAEKIDFSWLTEGAFSF